MQQVERKIASCNIGLREKIEHIITILGVFKMTQSLKFIESLPYSKRSVVKYFFQKFVVRKLPTSSTGEKE